MKEEYNKDMESLKKKKESNRNPGNKKILKFNKNAVKATLADWNK
jgi:hypothetical protein